MNRLLRSHYGRLTFGLILLGIAFHLWDSRHLELVGDEAYYWLWSRHPDICYLDKGPMIAWLIAAGAALFGPTEFGVRFFAVLLAAGTGVGIFLLAKHLFSERVGFWTVVLGMLVPLFAVGTSLMTPDIVYVFFWTWAALAFWKAKDQTRLAPWVVTGALVGLGMLAKYTAAIELICFAIFCLWHAPSRRHLRAPSFAVMVTTAFLFLVPGVFWNWQHGWPTIHWLVHRGTLDEPIHLQPLSALIFLGEQAAVISPLLFVGLMIALCRPCFGGTSRAERGYAVILFLPLFILYFALSFHYSGQPNWTAGAYIGGLILLAAAWDAPAHNRRWARWLAVTAILLAAVETAALHETSWLQLPRGMDPLDRARGSRQLAAAVKSLEEQTGAHFIIADNYMTAALLSFYLPGQPETFVPIRKIPFNQMELWPTYEQRHPVGDALVITERRRLPKPFRKAFPKAEPLGAIETTEAGRIMKRYKLFLCRRPAAVADDSKWN